MQKQIRYGGNALQTREGIYQPSWDEIRFPDICEYSRLRAIPNSIIITKVKKGI